ncbi:MAG: hypothetical protein JJE25_07010, partial [Bacteroidia bacterium]|nr:hypothetical protein [Bacteroidia bacterium]
GSPGNQKKQGSQSNEGSSKKSSSQPTDSFVSLEGSKSETEMEQDAKDTELKNESPMGYTGRKEQNRGQSVSVSSRGKNESSNKSGNLNKSSGSSKKR